MTFIKNKVVFFQPRTNAASNYVSNDGSEQTWTPWFALILSPAALISGWNVEIVDARVDSDNWKNTLNNINKEDILAISVMTGHAIKDAIIASEIAKKRKAIVVWGGPHVTLFPKQTLHEAPLDFCITGPGYFPFLNLVRTLKFNRVMPKVNGLFEKNNKIDLTASYVTSGSYDISYPNYCLDIIKDWEPYINADSAISERTANFITSEGCPRHCTFCSEPATSGRKWNTRNISQSVDDCIMMLKISGAHGLKLHDPNFFHEINRAKIFADKLSMFGNVPWAASAHPNDILNIPEEYLIDLSKKRLSRLLIGLESPVENIVKLSGKIYDPELIPFLAVKLKNARIRGMFTYIVGWPNADNSHYYETLDNAFSIKKIWDEHQCKIHFLEPWPGTPIFKLVSRNLGLTPPSSLQEWSDIDYYQAQYSVLHNKSIEKLIRDANKELSPYVNA